MTRRRRSAAALTIVPSTARDTRTGRFGQGNLAAKELRVLPGLDPATAAPWLRDHLQVAQRRYRGLKLSGLLKRFGSRLDGIARDACLHDAQFAALVALAATKEPEDARKLLAEARQAAHAARAAWARLHSYLGTLKRERGAEDPLGALAQELSGAGNDDNDEGSDADA